MYQHQQQRRDWTPRQPFRGPSSGFIDFAKATTDEIRQHLQNRGLDTAGSDGVLRSRLKRNVDQTKYGSGTPSGIEYLVVIDFEACCSDDDLDGCRPKAGSYEQEIIEFPAILVDVKKKEIVDVFHTHVQPTNEANRKLTAFCSKLTGITQEVIDRSPQFPAVLRDFEAWLAKHGLLGRKNWSTAADGRFDHTNFLYQACKINGLPYPEYAINYVKLPRAFKNIYRFCFTDPTAFPPNLEEMLQHFGMQFEGREHCGLDDATNMARCALKMLADGAELRPSDRVHPEEVDEERPYCCKVRGLLPEEWLELQKSIRDPSYRPKEVGRGDGRPWDEVQSLIETNRLESNGSEGVLRGRVALHETWCVTTRKSDRTSNRSFGCPRQFSTSGKSIQISQFDQCCSTPQGFASTELSGTTGETSSESSFADMFQAFETWTANNGCKKWVPQGGSHLNWCLVVNSKHALSFYLYSACATYDIAYPQWALFYIKLDTAFKKFYPACCIQVALPKLPEMVSAFGLEPAVNVCGDLAQVCLQMVKDKAPLQLTDQIYLEKAEGSTKPYSRITMQLQEREWLRIRQEILDEKKRSAH
ncbi:putative 3'-5' exoribonuclease 1 [Hypsibius exemplaris]|uniref:3'-5' exoribonuclease 1 n=1 Tax=Hypsibius exemplaris TaxID=2072580 RepID=A0A9X6NGI1_HYPEX|nr:putative 3'-5' exoribonuclease 1 [Hypsibius exemplaris]